MPIISRRRRSGSGATASPNATHLTITTQPVGGATPTVGTQPVVAAQDAGGSTDTTYVGTVVPTLNVLTGSATLGGSEAAGKACVAGVCTFTNLTVTSAAGATWTITFTSGSLTSATSSTGTTTGSGSTVSAPTLLTSGTDGSAGNTTLLTASVTPSASAVTVLRAYIGNTNTPTLPSGGRGTWTFVARQNNAAASATMYVWVGTGTASTGQISVPMSSGTFGGALWEVKDYPGGHQTTPVVAANTAGVTHASANTVLSIPVAQALGTGNAFDAGYAFGGGGGSGTPRAGWTELVDEQITSQNWFESQYRLTTDTAAEVTLPSAGYNGAGILIEINHA